MRPFACYSPRPASLRLPRETAMLRTRRSPSLTLSTCLSHSWIWFQLATFADPLVERLPPSERR
jgi:hypothetical protein